MEADRNWVPPACRTLPTGWQWRALGDVAQIDPRTPRPASGTVVPVVRMQAIDAEAGRIDEAEQLPIDTVGRHLRGFATGDVLLAKISPSFENGKVAVATGLDGDVGFGSSELHVLRPAAGLLPRYLWLILRREAVRAHLVPTMSGRAGQQRIARRALERIAIPVPSSLDEQAAVIDVAMRDDEPLRAVLSHTQRARPGVDLLREAVLEAATTSEAPWTFRLLADLVPRDRPVRYGIVQPGSETRGGVPYIRVRDFHDGTISVADLGHTHPEIAQRHRRAVLRAGDLLVSIRGTVGQIARVPPELDGAHTTQDAARISLSDESLSRWVALILRSPQTQRWFRDHTTGRAVQGVSVAALRSLNVPVPPSDEMLRRVSMATDALERLDEAAAAIDDAAALMYRVRETALLGWTLGQRNVAALPLLSLPQATAPGATPDTAQVLPPVAVPATAPAIVRAIGEAGGRVDATTLLDLTQMEADVFYRELWTAVQDQWLTKPAQGSSMLELRRAS